MSESTYLGWTFDQWAHASARYARSDGAALPANGSGMLKLSRWWREKGWIEPLAVEFADVKREQDRNWAADAIEALLVNAHGFGRSE